KMGKTILFVSHDLSSISKYCDRVMLLNQGKKLGEGSPKEMIDAYKQVLVGQYPLPEDNGNHLLDDHEIGAAAAKAGGEKKPAGQDGKGHGKVSQGEPGGKLLEQNAVNPELLEYGTKAAVIEEYSVTDEAGRKTGAIIKGQFCSVHMTVRFQKDIHAPIFAFTIKNSKGVEITGTNTMVEKAFLEPVSAGAVKKITFTQKLDLQGGEYLLSLGVTGYEKEDFQVYHRLYDVMNITVISDKDTVGYYDMNSSIQVTD
ncbi:MAG: Wzt carbohydrate-binding domain-containing protein, partial [Lachnospiraceae bacterium]|nr:Wzt carbohydrate-binding domain-containing protein [Lachnospiraceae bacterium]